MCVEPQCVRAWNRVAYKCATLTFIHTTNKIHSVLRTVLALAGLGWRSFVRLSRCECVVDLKLLGRSHACALSNNYMTMTNDPRRDMCVCAYGIYVYRRLAAARKGIPIIVSHMFMLYAYVHMFCGCHQRRVARTDRQEVTFIKHSRLNGGFVATNIVSWPHSMEIGGVAIDATGFKFRQETARTVYALCCVWLNWWKSCVMQTIRARVH